MNLSIALHGRLGTEDGYFTSLYHEQLLSNFLVVAYANSRLTKPRGAYQGTIKQLPFLPAIPLELCGDKVFDRF